MAETYRRYGLTGGGAGSLDALDGTPLSNNDVAFTVDATNTIYPHALNSSSGEAESSPTTIAPDTNAGNKRWKLSAWWARAYNGLTLLANAVGFSISGGTTSKTLTVEDTSLINQDLTTDASPTFTQVNATTVHATTTLTDHLGEHTGAHGTLYDTAIADNTATTQIATTAFAKSQDAVLARLPDQAVNMTYAASGSSGITVADDAVNGNTDFGTGNFTLVWRGSLPDWSPSTTLKVISKSPLPSVNGYLLYWSNAALPALRLAGSAYTPASVSPGFIDGTTHHIVVVITAPTASVAGSATFYNDGLLLGTVVSIDAGLQDVSTSDPLYVLGDSAVRNAGTCSFAATYNRALTAAEVLDLYRNGIAYADKWGSQTAQTSGTLVIGKRYRIDNWITNDDFTNVGGANVDGTEFVATGTTPTIWTNSSTVYPIGATIALEPEGIQPSPGQWLDSSSNKLHAMQPVTGSSLTRKKDTFEVRWTNTWAGTHEAQYIGGVNQAVLPIGCYIDSIIGVITGATIEDIILGDGSDTDRWVTITTGLATGTKVFTIANNISDGTNYKLVVDPDANFTGSIAWTITGRILQ